MIAWTDYPLCNECRVWGPVLDSPHQQAPIREVEVLGWEPRCGNKYARIRFEADTVKGVYCIKVGYLYQRPGRAGGVPMIDTSNLQEVDVYAVDHDSVHWDGEHWICDHCNQPVDWS